MPSSGYHFAALCIRVLKFDTRRYLGTLDSARTCTLTQALVRCNLVSFKAGI